MACEGICAALGNPKLPEEWKDWLKSIGVNVEVECKKACKLVAEESAKTCPPDTIRVC
jgi:hypothetical protein